MMFACAGLFIINAILEIILLRKVRIWKRVFDMFLRFSGVSVRHGKISHLVASLPTSCVRTACRKLSTSLEQAVSNL
jgi:hypothetical protein